MPSVLVVEDDPDIGKLILLLLRRSGVDGALRTDGAAGLAAVTELRPDLLVLDVGLPILDGWQVLERVRAADGPRLPVLLLSAHAQETDRARGRRMGADEFVLKPFRNDDLVARVGALLSPPTRTCPTASPTTATPKTATPKTATPTTATPTGATPTGAGSTGAEESR
jgi:DNA-binding response OmpR family regulator